MRLMPIGWCMLVCAESAAVYCSGSALKDPVTSLIQSLGNTKVLSREVESKLTTIIRKGLNMEASITAREAKLRRPLSVSEVVQLLVSPCKPPAKSFGALYMTQAFMSCTKMTQLADFMECCAICMECCAIPHLSAAVTCRVSSPKSMCCWCGRMRQRRAIC